MTVQEIAQQTKVPSGYLSKVLQALGRARLVQSQRGLHGGFSLLKAPKNISVLDVVTAVDEIPRIHHCPLGLGEHEGKLCPLHRRLDDAAAMIEEAFGNTSIAELLVSEDGIRALCENQSTT